MPTPISPKVIKISTRDTGNTFAVTNYDIFKDELIWILTHRKKLFAVSRRNRRAGGVASGYLVAAVRIVERATGSLSFSSQAPTHTRGILG